MKIDEEAFSKLKQLDRIEFRQRYRNIVETWSYNYSITNLFLFLVIALLFFIIDFVQVAQTILKLGIVLFAFEVLAKVMSEIKLHKETQKLEKKYFKLELNTK